MDLEDRVKMEEVLRPVGAIYKYVIKEDDDIISKVWRKDLINEGLKCGWGITKAKGHDPKFKMPMVVVKGDLRVVR